MGEVNTWTVADASNVDLFPENMPFGDVNDSGRAVQGAIARWFADTNGSIVASGSAGAYTITSNRTIASLVNNTVMWFRANHTNTGAATLNLNGIGVRDIVRATGSALTAGDITSGQIVGVYFNSSLDDWVLITPAVQGTASESATGLIELATDAEVEALDSSRAVRASTMHRHPGHPKAWINFDGTGTVGITADHGVTSIVDNGTGDYDVNWDTAFATANYCISGIAGNVGGNHNTGITILSALEATVAHIATGNPAQGTAGDRDPVFVVAFGDHA